MTDQPRPLSAAEEARLRRLLDQATGKTFLPIAWQQIVSYLPGLLAALDAARSAGAGLDVERLARAITNVDSGPGWNVDAQAREDAQEYAAEYARLAAARLPAPERDDR